MSAINGPQKKETYKVAQNALITVYEHGLFAPLNSTSAVTWQQWNTNHWLSTAVASACGVI